MSLNESTIESTAAKGSGGTTDLTVTIAGGKFVIDGVSQRALTFIPGNTYKFDVSDDDIGSGNHILRFATAEDAGGSSEYTTGVTVSGSPGDSGAYVQITITTSTPTTLYYYCTAHPRMGAAITIDTTSPLVLDGNTGQITGSRFLFEGGRISGSKVDYT